MIINKITIERTFNLGNYQSEKLGMEVAYSDEDAPADFVAEVRKLRAMVLEAAGNHSAPAPKPAQTNAMPSYEDDQLPAWDDAPEAHASKDVGAPTGMYVYKIPFSMKQQFKDDAWEQKARAKWDGDRKCWACVSEVKGWQEYRQ